MTTTNLVLYICFKASRVCSYLKVKGFHRAGNTRLNDKANEILGNPYIKCPLLLTEKLYSDSSFYRTEDNLYPTITEQMRLAKLISGNLEAPDAMRSRGGKMYFKRKQKAGEWTKEAMGRKLEHEYSGGGPGRLMTINSGLILTCLK